MPEVPSRQYFALLSLYFRDKVPLCISSMSSERTPERSKRVYATTVQRLNRWDLGLPEELVVRRQITNLDDEQKLLQRECAKHIEYLSWRPESGLESLLDEFDEWADASFKSWRPKPLQEKGTLQVFITILCLVGFDADGNLDNADIEELYPKRFRFQTRRFVYGRRFRETPERAINLP